MNIKINKKTHKIKPASELSISEYVKVFAGLEKRVSNLEILIRYISVTTGIKYNNVADIDISESTIRRLFAYIGEIQEAKDMPENISFYHKKSGKTLYRDPLNWRTIGVRKLLEERKAETQIEQAVYLMAIYLSADYDHENIEEIYQELQDYNAIEVLSFVIFFFKKLHVGKKSDKSFLKTLLKKASINTAIRSSK